MKVSKEQIRKSLEEGLTQSELMLRSNCIRKWMFQYILMLKFQGSFAWWSVVGSAVHKMLENVYSGKIDRENIEPIDFDFEPDVLLTPQQQEEYKYWKLVTKVMVHRHNRYFQEHDSRFKVELTEQILTIEYRGFKLKGQIDLVGVGLGHRRPWIMDHKTAADISDKMLEGWQFRFQFLFYSWLWMKHTGERPTGIFVNILKKPLEKRSVRKQETIEDWVQRIDQNIIISPELYFRREWVPLDNQIMHRFEKYTLDPLLTQVQMLEDAIANTGRFNEQELNSMLLAANTDQCMGRYGNSPCEYLNLCKNDFNDFASEYITRHVKHVELERLTAVNPTPSP